MSTAATLAALALAIWIVPAGIAAASFVRRENELWPEDSVAVGLTVGLGIVLFASSGLARLGWLTATTFWLIGGLVAVLSIVTLVATRRRLTLPSRGSLTTLLVVVTPLLIAAIAFSPHLASIAVRPDAVPGTTPWYYWDLAAQTSAANGFPETSVEWGEEVPFLDDYAGFTAVTAGVALASSRPELVFSAHLLRLIAALGSGFAIWYLSRSWGASKYGAASAIFLFAALEVFASKLLSYRPEAAGYMLMLLVPALAKRWLDRGQRVFAVSSAIGLAALGLVHGLTWTMGAILLIATALATLLISDNRKRIAVRAGVLFAVAFGLWAVTSLAIQGRVTEAEKLTTAPVVSESGIDPTWEFSALVSGSAGSPPPTAAEMIKRVFSLGFVSLPAWVFWSVALVAFILIIAAAANGDRTSGQLLLTVLLFAMGVTFVAVFFAIGWDTYVPRRTGFVRLMQISVFVVPLALAVGMSRFGPTRTRGITTVLVSGCVALLAAAAFDISERGLGEMPLRPAMSQLRSLDLSGVALANGYTEGFLATNLGLQGVLEGRAPYTDAALLDRTTISLEKAQEFFANPRDSTFDTSPYDILIAATQPWAMGSANPFPVDVAGFRATPGFTVVAENPHWVILKRANP